MSSNGPQRDAMLSFCEHVAGTASSAIPAPARHAASVFLLDSLGVGIAGSRGPLLEPLMAAHAGAAEARLLGQGRGLPAGGAALLNACQIHNSEFDCVHEAAVVHPMAVLLGALLAFMERERGRHGRRFHGRELVDAIVLGVDVACSVGLACRSGLRFFRPATAGAFAATAGIGRLAGFDSERLLAAMGITYSQLCGTMQAHTEGSPVLAMQVGFNARNALLACDLALGGVSGPRNVLQGPFGYFALFEGEYDIAPVLAGLGRSWRILEVAHKPYPSGRATHGVVEACLGLAREHGLRAAGIAAVRAWVPPLTHRLVGRAAVPGMAVSTARLCAPFAAARAIVSGGLGLADFDPAALADADALALARRIELVVDGNPDPNALGPVAVEITCRDGGAALRREIDTVYGNPAKPMSRDAQLQKFHANGAAGVRPLGEERRSAAVGLIDELDALDDTGTLLDCVL